MPGQPFLFPASDFVRSSEQVFTLQVNPTQFGDGSENLVVSNVALKAVAIAPDSDLDLVTISYQSLIDGGLQLQWNIAPGAPYSGLIKVPNTSDPDQNVIIFDPGRLFAGADIDTWFATASGGVGGQSPYLKLFGYLDTAPASLPRGRSPYVAAGPFVFSGSDQNLGRVPFYGRGLFQASFLGASGNAGDITLKIYGVRFQSVTAPVVGTRALLTTITLSANETEEYSFQNKFYDAIEITGTEAVAGSPGGFMHIECADLAIA